jgi:hypothetical protein
VRVEYNEQLASFEGLANLSAIGGDLTIAENHALSSVSTLSGAGDSALALAGNLRVEGNGLGTSAGLWLCRLNVTGSMHLNFADSKGVVLNTCSLQAFDEPGLRHAVGVWCSNPQAAEAAYGHINFWDVSSVADMSELFEDCVHFDDEIGASLRAEYTRSPMCPPTPPCHTLRSQFIPADAPRCGQAHGTRLQ